jgi:hypothetical protein
MANLFSCIFEVKFDLSAHIASLSRFQVLAIVVILSSNYILHELKGLLSLLLISVPVEFCQFVHNLALSFVAPENWQVNTP